MSSDKLISELECPVCLLPPRDAPVFMCPLGHNICFECRPKVKKCPICKINYRQKEDTRNFFVEKILDSLERNCRFELFDCDYSTCDSKQLVNHEKTCSKKPELYEDLRKSDDSDGENVEENNNENNNNQPLFLNLIYFYDIRPMFQFYAYTTVFLRMFLYEFSDRNRHSGVLFEVILLLCLALWLLARRIRLVQIFLEVYQPDEFETQLWPLRKHLRNILFQDSNEIYMSLILWSWLVICSLLFLKLSYSNLDEIDAAQFEALMFFLKPAVTFLTSLVCVGCHLYFKWGKLDRLAAMFGVFRLLWLSFNLAFVELTLNTGTVIDEGYCLIFWIQAVTILLPFGKVSFILLELFGFLTMTYNAYDTMFIDGIGKTDLMENLQKAFNGNYLKMEYMLKELNGSLKFLETSLNDISDMKPLEPEVAKEILQFFEKYRAEL